MNELEDFVEATRTEFGIPGVAVGIRAGGRELVACHGVTSIDNPLPVDPDTVFVLGSVTKTFTATALLRLVARGEVDLAAPVRRYVPELRLADERAAERITVLQLLNHTSGLDLGGIVVTDDGDDALTRYVESMRGLDLVAPPGTRASYSQAGYNLAGRIVANVTGLTYERAVAELVLEPLGLAHSFFAVGDVLTRRFVVGHNRDADGTLSVARLWKRWRGDNPGGGLASSVSDQLRWARYHLDEGEDDQLLRRMKEPTVELRGSALGEAIGIGWFLRDVDGVRTVGHGGSTNGQFAELLMVPERDFAVVSLANAGPDGVPFNRAVVRWALRTYLGLVDRDPEPLPYDEARAREVAGSYATDAQLITISSDGTGLTLTAGIRPEIRAAATMELPPDYPPAGIGLLPRDELIVTTGGLTGQRGFFSRDGHGRIVGVDLAGRLYPRQETPTPSPGARPAAPTEDDPT